MIRSPGAKGFTSEQGGDIQRELAGTSGGGSFLGAMSLRTYRYALGGAAAFLFVMALGVAWRNDLWFDEIFTYDTAVLPLTQLIEKTSKDVHPPLYYLVAKPFAHGFNEPLLRLPSVIAGTLSLLLFSSAIGAVFGKRYGVAFAILFALSPTIIRYSAEARQYALVLFFWSLSLWVLAHLSLAKEQRIQRMVGFLAVYVLALIGGLYTHNLYYFPMIMSGLVAVLVAINLSHRFGLLKTAGTLFGVHLIALLAYLPWIAVVRFQIDTMSVPLSWMPLPWLDQLRETYALLPFSIFEHKRALWHAIPGRLLLMIGPYIFFWAAWRARTWTPAARLTLIILAAGSIFTTAIVYAVSHYYVRIFFSQRYVSIVTPVVLLALVPLVTNWPRARWQQIFQGAMLLIIVATMATYSLRMLWVPLHTDIEHVISLASGRSHLVDQTGADDGAPLYAVWVNFTEEACFEAYAKHRAPGLQARPISELWLEGVTPSPESPVWIVVAQRPWQSGDPRAGIAAYVINNAEFGAHQVLTPTFQAFLLIRIDWEGVRHSIDALENPGAAYLALNLFEQRKERAVH